jgi:hypothetical protein
MLMIFNFFLNYALRLAFISQRDQVDAGSGSLKIPFTSGCQARSDECNNPTDLPLGLVPD